MDIFSPISHLRGVTTKITKPLQRLGIETIKDLFWHVPFRYDDLSQIVSIADLHIGDTATIVGEVEHVEQNRSWKRGMHITSATISDKTGVMQAIWFNQPFLAKTLTVGKYINLSGKCTNSSITACSFQNPAYEIVGANTKPIHTGRLVPIYKETSGITSRWLRYLVKNAFLAISEIEDILPAYIQKNQKLVSIKKAIEDIHFPVTVLDAEAAKKRLAFEELFLIQIFLLQMREKMKQIKAPDISYDIDITKKFISTLPFSLTHAQKRSAWEILQDMARSYPMNRLLEGEVGSGKTVVAAIACLNAAKQKWQSAIMAPTEILANQHFATLSKLFLGSGYSVGLLTKSTSLLYDEELDTAMKITKTDFLKMSASGKIDVTIGTHALLSSALCFAHIGLVILDEQHRFGVEQRADLVKKHTANGKIAPLPHFLSMTATPIPRTLALTIYGDLDISLLDEMPEGRKKVSTSVIPPEKRDDAYAFIKSQVKEGKQVFVVCPRIDTQTNSKKDEKELTPRAFSALQIKSVKEEYEKLSKDIFPNLRVGMLHGRMKAKEKEEIMYLLKEKKIDILVSTSVIEVGIDIPDATIIMIEGAERFGLAQLHQFRGRVGRSTHKSYCFLFTSDNAPDTTARLKAMEECDDGFELAKKDLAIRGPGDFLGSRQSGIPDLTMASLTDMNTVKSARAEATALMKKDATLHTYPLLKKRILELNKYH